MITREKRVKISPLWKFSLIYLLLIIHICYCHSSEFNLSTKTDNGYLTHFESYDEAAAYMKANFTYRKCYCKLQEAWKDGTCIPIKTEAVVLLLQNWHSESEILFSFVFSTVDIRDVDCTPAHVLLNLKQNNLYLLHEDELYSEEIDYLFARKDYCFEFIEEDDSIDIVARVCLPSPPVPFCDNGSKELQDISSLNLNISFNNDYIFVNNLSKLNTTEPKCVNGEQKVFLPLENESKNLSFHYMSNNVQLLWHPPFPANVPKVYSSDEYCISRNNTDRSFYVAFCYDDPLIRHETLCKDSVCVRKCCPEHHVYNILIGSCSLHEKPNNVTLFSFYDLKNKTFINDPDNLVIEYSFPWCQNNRLYIIDPKMNSADEFFILKNGSLYLGLSNLTMPPSLYCVDSFLESQDHITVKAISCFLEETEEFDQCKRIHRILYPVLIVVSCVFLSITLIVYAVTPELHAKLHGKSLVSHVVSLLIAFLCQLVVSWSSKSLSMTGCKIVALGNQVSFLWAFFWLNVMCFDIWWTLKTMSPVPETGESSRRRFALYSLYAWGCPLVICFVTALLEFLPSTSTGKTNFILPGFGVRGCWFQDVKSTWIYFHGFTLSLYVLNIFFFFHVALILLKGQRATEGILRTTRKQDKERIYLYLKLFVVMGITWVCEVASWQEGTCKYWIFTDIVNSFQGVMIFFIFMCNRMVFQKLHARGLPFFRRLKTIVRAPSSTDSGPGETRANSSSQRTIQTEELSLRRLSSVSHPQINK